MAEKRKSSKIRDSGHRIEQIEWPIQSIIINERKHEMSTVAEKEMEHIGETKGAQNHDHDMIHDLSNRLDALWRYDQYTANAAGDEELKNFWQDMKEQEQSNVKRLKELVKKHTSKDCF